MTQRDEDQAEAGGGDTGDLGADVSRGQFFLLDRGDQAAASGQAADVVGQSRHEGGGSTSGGTTSTAITGAERSRVYTQHKLYSGRI